MGLHLRERERRSLVEAVAGVASVALILLMGLGVMAVVSGCSDRREEGTMDGSTAGANAVTLEDLAVREACDEYLAGAWSVTVEDLEREYEMGEVYPANGKNTPLSSGTTYGKGAGMVDIITFDRATNVEIRHYGQLQPDGTVRWYAAETVLDEDGNPVVVPRE